jgi:hypothetical protein
MEAWKFVNYSSLSPVFALGFTTARWGLEPFPGNLVAISGEYNDTIDFAWALPYSCDVNQTAVSSYYDCTGTDAECGDGESINTNLTTICDNPIPCANSGCLILIEGIGDTVTGPAHSHIVPLAYGISVLIVLITTFVLIFVMGCFSSKSDSEDTYDTRYPPSRNIPRERLAPVHLPQYNPPQAPLARIQKAPKWAELQATASSNSTEVARCADLLREMYGLELVIWGTQHANEEDIPEREAQKVKANALYAEILRLVRGWNAVPRSQWKPAEWDCVEEINKVIDGHDDRRYTSLG